MRVTLTLSAGEWQGLRRLSTEALRTPKEQLRWLLRQALLSSGQDEQFSTGQADRARFEEMETDE